jgi:hypothetical protein
MANNNDDESHYSMHKDGNGSVEASEQFGPTCFRLLSSKTPMIAYIALNTRVAR